MLSSFSIIISIGNIPPNQCSTFFKSIYNELLGLRSDSNELPVATFDAPAKNIKVSSIDTKITCLGFLLTNFEKPLRSLILLISFLFALLVKELCNIIIILGMNVRVNT